MGRYHGKERSEELVMQRQAEEPQGVVPDWAVMLTAGVDVQETSVYYDIVAWGAEWTSQSIIHGQLLSLNDLEMYMNAEYKNSSGEQFYVNAMFNRQWRPNNRDIRILFAAPVGDTR